VQSKQYPTKYCLKTDPAQPTDVDNQLLKFCYCESQRKRGTWVGHVWALYLHKQVV